MTASEAHQPGAGRRAPAIKAVVVTALAVPLALAAAPVCIGAALWVSADVDTVGDSRFERELWIPPLLDPHADRAGRKVFELDLREGRAELLPGTTTATLWYHPHLWAGPRTTSTAGSPGRS